MSEKEDAKFFADGLLHNVAPHIADPYWSSQTRIVASALVKYAARIEELESRELGYIQSLRDLEARVRELERQNSLLLDDVQGIAEAVIPYCDASDFAYAVKRDCAETLKAIATKG